MRLARVRPNLAVGEVDDDVEIACAEQAVGTHGVPQRRCHRQQRLPPCLERGEQIGRRRIPPCLQIGEPRRPVGLIPTQVRLFVGEDRRDVGVADRVGHLDGIGGDLDGGARNGEHPLLADGVDARQERRLVGKDRHLVARDHVEVPEIFVEEARWSSTRHNGAGTDFHDVAHRTRRLRLDLGLTEPALLVVGQVVHHRVPDRPRVLQPVQVDRAMRPQCTQVGGAAVVLIHEPALAVEDHHRRVAPRPVGDRRLGMDRNGQPWGELDLLAVDGLDEVREPEQGERAFLFVCRVPGQHDRDVATQVLAQPRLVVVVGVQMGDVEEVGLLDAVEEIVVQLIVAREYEPRSEERGNEPGVAENGACVGLDEDPGVADRGRAHRSEGTGTMLCAVRRPGLIRRRADRCTAGRRVTRARSTVSRPSTAARTGSRGRRTSLPALRPPQRRCRSRWSLFRW